MQTDTPKTSRREWLYMCGRLALGGCLATLGGFFLSARRRPAAGGGPDCPTGGGCGGCQALARCGLPRALSIRKKTVWQLDPEKCVQCGKCATACVMSPSAVKCVHAYAMCGFCELCGGFHQPHAMALDTAAENQLCPTGAIRRTFVEDPYYEYTIDEPLCIGCGKCVSGCASFGNGSLFLQVRHDRCRNCNECAIAKVCPSGAFKRVPADQPYLLKGASPT